MGSAIDALGEAGKFDAIIVDEAQDFTSAWWFPVEMMLRDSKESRWYVLHDPVQARVYGQGESLPNIAVSVELNTNCRNTRKIAGYCGKVIDRESRTRDGAPEGELPVVGNVSPMANDRRQQAVDVVSRWVAAGLSPDRIAILSPWNEQNSRSVLNGLGAVGAVPVRVGEGGLQPWIDGKAFFGCTIKAFKGLEADCILICDVPECGAVGFNAADMYVAASRAKARLHFIPETQAAADQIRAWIQQVAAQAGN
jgi:superfamily I DNA/RNA helicase